MGKTQCDYIHFLPPSLLPFVETLVKSIKLLDVVFFSCFSIHIITI